MSLPGTFAVAVPQTSQEGRLMGSEQKDLASVEPLPSLLGCISWCWALRTLSPALETSLQLGCFPEEQHPSSPDGGFQHSPSLGKP